MLEVELCYWDENFNYRMELLKAKTYSQLSFAPPQNILSSWSVSKHTAFLSANPGEKGACGTEIDSRDTN